MNLSNLIAILQETLAKEGDLPVSIEDDGCEYMLWDDYRPCILEKDEESKFRFEVSKRVWFPRRVRV